MKLISFVIPCYRSEHTLPGVIEEIDTKMSEYNRFSYEVILVNDCSPDGTLATIRSLCSERPEGNGVRKGISFARNFGQHSALMAGLRASTGDYVVCLDDDGQTPANEVDRLIDRLEEGYDAVYAKYEHKKHSIFRNMGSKVNELMTRVMLDKPASLYVSSYFAVRRFVVEDMIRYENSYPYVIGLVLRATKNITNVVVNHREREEGHSRVFRKAPANCNHDWLSECGTWISVWCIHDNKAFGESQCAHGLQLFDGCPGVLRRNDYDYAGLNRGVCGQNLYQHE